MQNFSVSVVPVPPLRSLTSIPISNEEWETTLNCYALAKWMRFPFKGQSLGSRTRVSTSIQSDGYGQQEEKQFLLFTDRLDGALSYLI